MDKAILVKRMSDAVRAAGHSVLTDKQVGRIAAKFADDYTAAHGRDADPTAPEINGNLLVMERSHGELFGPPPSIERATQFLLQGVSSPEQRMQIARECAQLDPDARIALGIPADFVQEPVQKAEATPPSEDGAPSAEKLAKKALGKSEWRNLSAIKQREMLQYIERNVQPQAPAEGRVTAEMRAKGITDVSQLHPRDRLAYAREQADQTRKLSG